MIIKGDDCKERVCIQTKKVFDACKKEMTLTDTAVAVTDITIDEPTLPLTYVSAKSTSAMATIEDLVITPLTDRPPYANVAFDAVIGIKINFTDDSGTAGSGTSSITVPVSTVLSLPNASVFPYDVEAVVSASSTIGTYVGTSVIDGVVVYMFRIDICVVIIVKIVMTVELIVASYGYAVIPTCVDYNEEVCSAFFDLPLFPNGTT
ncbi:MAG: hypothetical protein PHX51_05600 [Clostridia bacterium]|nr:hypothetical protein [Clostridia bacterium]